MVRGCSVNVVSVGEILWDVFPNAEHLGGAPFNLAAHLQKLGHRVYFVSAVGDDERGRKALKRATELGIPTRFIGVAREAPTGSVAVSVGADGQPTFVIQRPAPYDATDLSGEDLAELAGNRPDWVAFGTLHQTDPRARTLLGRLFDSLPAARRFYDVNLRAECYTVELAQQLLSLADVVKLNEDEFHELAPSTSVEEFSREGARRHGWQAVCITRGSAGCWALVGDEFVSSPGYRVKVSDAVGAGDAFSAAFHRGLDRGWPPSRIADFSNRVGALIASRPGAIPAWSVEEAEVLEPLGSE